MKIDFGTKKYLFAIATIHWIKDSMYFFYLGGGVLNLRIANFWLHFWFTPLYGVRDSVVEKLKLCWPINNRKVR